MPSLQNNVTKNAVSCHWNLLWFEPRVIAISALRFRIMQSLTCWPFSKDFVGEWGGHVLNIDQYFAGIVWALLVASNIFRCVGYALGCCQEVLKIDLEAFGTRYRCWKMLANLIEQCKRMMKIKKHPRPYIRVLTTMFRNSITHPENPRKSLSWELSGSKFF